MSCTNRISYREQNEAYLELLGEIKTELDDLVRYLKRTESINVEKIINKLDSCSVVICTSTGVR
jgi:hypothetical protein